MFRQADGGETDIGIFALNTQNQEKLRSGIILSKSAKKGFGV
jgi:hypothetical protein